MVGQEAKPPQGGTEEEVIVEACPRCGSIDKRTANKGPRFVEYACQMCGKLFMKSESNLMEFDGEKKKRPKKFEDSWLFPEMMT